MPQKDKQTTALVQPEVSRVTLKENKSTEKVKQQVIPRENQNACNKPISLAPLPSLLTQQIWDSW